MLIVCPKLSSVQNSFLLKKLLAQSLAGLKIWNMMDLLLLIKLTSFSSISLRYICGLSFIWCFKTTLSLSRSVMVSRDSLSRSVMVSRDSLSRLVMISWVLYHGLWSSLWGSLSRSVMVPMGTLSQSVMVFGARVLCHGLWWSLEFSVTVCDGFSGFSVTVCDGF